MTCNIEDVKANKFYLQKLCQDNDKQWLKNEIMDFEPFVRCHDSNDNISNFNVPRGRAGVAILWNKNLSDIVSRLEVGNERVMAVEINGTNKLCIINAYLTTSKSDSEYGYRECLDVIHDIIQRFISSHTVLLCGDLNGSLLETRNNKHDVILKDFVKNHCLSNGTFESNQPTFYHFNGHVTSQIDYVLSSDTQILATYDILNREPLNVSKHVPIRTTLCVYPDGESTVHCR